MSTQSHDRSSPTLDMASASDAEAQTWETLPELELLAEALARLLDFAQAPSDDALVPVGEFYEVVARRLSVEDRLFLKSLVFGGVFGAPGLAAALLALALLDADQQVSSVAAMDYAMLQPQAKGDPLTGPNILALNLMLGSRTPRQQLAMLTGLVLLGDERLLPLVKGRWRQFEPAEDRRLLAAAASESVSTLRIEFLLDWLEHTTDEHDIGAIAGAMVRMPAISCHGGVVREERTFPASEAEKQGDSPIRCLDRWRFDEYLEVIRPRLEALIAKESEPKVLPAIIEAWSA
jgi:hypothetical protein